MLVILLLTVVNPQHNPQVEGPLVGRLQLLIQYICNYLPLLEAVSSIHNLRTHCAVVTRNPLDMD
jgi:hypothetical protein